MTDITQDMIDCWRINYGLDKRSPAEAAQWWHEHCGGYAPSGAVAALGTALVEIDRLRAALRQAVPALESCLEDSLQVINERTRDWGQYKLTQQRQMAAEYETHRAVLEAARAALGE